MKVTLTQFFSQRICRGWIFLRLETERVCTEISTSCAFDPYPELYTWLGQVCDRQLPAKMAIDEEGYGVYFIAEFGKSDDTICFHIEPWMCRENRFTRLEIEIDRHQFVTTFCDAIVEFIKTEYQPLEWSKLDNLTNLNWARLTQTRRSPSPNWKLRLAMYGGGRSIVPETQRDSLWQYLAIEQQWLVTLYHVLHTIAALARYGKSDEVYQWVGLYQHLIIDLALNELDPSWYETRKADLEREFDGFAHSAETRSRKLLIHQGRLATLKVGQLVDGTVRGVRSYGIFVDIGGISALLHISEISQVSLEHPKQVFLVDDWVRAIIIALDVERKRITLSTRELEPEPGDMLKSPLSVYKKAEKMAKRYRQNGLNR